MSAVELILFAGPGDVKTDKKTNYNALADWIVNREDASLFLKFNNPLRQFYFTKIDADHWIKLIHFYPAAITEKIFELITQDISVAVMEQLLTVLQAISITGNSNHLLVSQIQRLPGYFSELSINSDRNSILLSGSALVVLFWIEKKLPQAVEWVNAIAEIITRNPQRNYVNKVLVPQLLALTERTVLTGKILLPCRQYLQQRVNNKAQPPADWSRLVPATTENKKQWQLLTAFLESPTEQFFEYRKNQSERDQLEIAISSVVIDLITETIKKGSPHTLRIVKTQATYNREMKKWNEDMDLLNKIDSIS